MSGTKRLMRPTPGEWERLGNFTLASARAAWMSYQIGGTGASDNDGLVAVYAGLTNSVDVAGVRPRIKTGLGAVTLTAKYRGDGSGVPTFRNRWMRVTPRRIG